MIYAFIIFQFFLLFSVPAILLKLQRHVRFVHSLGPVVLCYAAGFALSLSPFPVFHEQMSSAASVAAVLSIPMILFGFNLSNLRQLSRNVWKAFLLMVVSVLIIGSLLPLLAEHLHLSCGTALSGMMIGLYTGGTPNLVAVGQALLPASLAGEITAAANAADMIVGGVWFLLLLTFVAPVYLHFLGCRDFSSVSETIHWNPSDRAYNAVNEYDLKDCLREKKDYLKLAGLILLSFALMAAGAVLELCFNGSLDGSMYIIITVSIGGILCSLMPSIRQVKGCYQFGQYLICVFIFGIAASMDFRLLIEELIPTLLFFAAAQISCLFLHFILCRIAHVDGATAIITSTAGIYGPPFIAPAAAACRNDSCRELIAPGILCGVMGLSIGNLLGLSAGKLLEIIY